MSDERRVKKPLSQTEPAAKRRKRIGAKRAPEGRKKHNQEKTKELRFPIDESEESSANAFSFCILTSSFRISISASAEPWAAARG